ncbi:hypothetical protein, partial [Bacillus sp. P14.5]|uniref:hypothetical protein n=1 Tax=Bacillus sp. P14.5 TaxID=1983400 RepID=UPI001962BAAA
MPLKEEKIHIVSFERVGSATIGEKRPYSVLRESRECHYKEKKSHIVSFKRDVSATKGGKKPYSVLRERSECHYRRKKP